MFAGGDAREEELAVGTGMYGSAFESECGAGDERLRGVANRAGERCAVGAGSGGWRVIAAVGSEGGLRSRVQDSETSEDGGDEELKHVCVFRLRFDVRVRSEIRLTLKQSTEEDTEEDAEMFPRCQ